MPIRFLWRALALAGGAAAAAAVLLAAPPLSIVQDTLYKADGSYFNGTITVSWKSFTASDNSSIPGNVLKVPVVNGVIRMKLAPTVNASQGAYYSATYWSDGRQFTELWSVPQTAGVLKLKDIRIPAPPGLTAPAGNTVLQLSDVVGLVDALGDRPLKGLGYVGGRVLMASPAGDLASVTGSPGDCVRADGSTGPCGAPVTLPVFVDMETPVGAVDGVNANFGLSLAPNPAGSLHLYRNGILQKAGVDYSLTGATVTFLPLCIPQPGDILSASYRSLP